MKRLIHILPVLMLSLILPLSIRAQKQELQQLALDIEKLSELKSMLSDMQSAYRTLARGYEQVKSVTEGNFSLHQLFLSSLLLVNPSVKKYVRIADIISADALIIKEYKAAFTSFKSSQLFKPTEIQYMGSVYSHLFEQTLQNMDELTLVLTSGRLRMSDEERLRSIDRLYADTYDKLSFLRSFNRKANNILAHRKALQSQGKTLEKIFGQD